MTNEEALDVLAEVVLLSQQAVTAGTWAEAFLTFGGEATWDAVKSISRICSSLSEWAEAASLLEEEFDNIIP